MDEGDRDAVNPDSRHGVDELHARGMRVGQGPCHVGHRVGDVMESGSSLRQELADGRVLVNGGKQLDLGAAHLQKSSLEALVLRPRAMRQHATEMLCVHIDSALEIVDRDSDVMELHFGYVYQPSPVLRPSLPDLTFASSSGDGR